MQKDWQHRLENAQEDFTLPEAPMEVPALVWKLLYSRGIQDKEVIESHLSPSLRGLRDPMSLDGMEKAVSRLLDALENSERVCIYGDFDLDGTSGLALLKGGLLGLGFEDVTYYQPKRLTEGYGVHPEAIKKLAEDGVNLIVTVDVGITAVSAVDLAGDLGVDVIITDHHLPKEELPRALSIVNPNTNNCDSGLGHLCGAGVGFYLILALRRRMIDLGILKKEFDPKSLLDCFTVGTLTDMVPLVHENRVLVKHGLVELENTKRPGLKALLEVLGLSGRPLSAQDVAIRFAPKLNALSRMESGILPIDIYLEEDPVKAGQLVKEMLGHNEKRLEYQARAQEEAMDWVENNPQNGFIWVASENFHKGVVGLVATKLSNEFNVPAFVGSINDKGQIVGSSRSPREYPVSVLKGLEAAESSLEKFGGHDAAAGFEVLVDNFKAFEKHLNDHFNSKESGQGQPQRIFYDAQAGLEEFNPTFMKWYDAMGPFGADYEVPTILISDISVKGLKELRGGHIKMSWNHRLSHSSLDALWFFPPSSHPAITKIKSGGEIIDALVEPQWNYFAGRKSVQLLVKDLRLST